MFLRKLLKPPLKVQDYRKEKEWLLREKYGGIETPEFFEDLQHLKTGEPIDYLIGFFDFLGCKIDLSFRPLIPRAETEWWVEKAMKNIMPEKTSILDIFSGSGCIGIALLKRFPNARVDFGEKEPSFAAQIEKNIVINGIDRGRTHVFVSDVFARIPRKKYDYIFANPPYISREKVANVQKSVRKYEPDQALFAEDNGLFHIKKLLAEAPQFLAPNGKLFIEFDSWQKDEIEKLLADSPLHAEFWKDQYDQWRTAVFSSVIQSQKQPRN